MLIHRNILLVLITLTIASSCANKPGENLLDCSTRIWSIPNCEDCDGYLGLYGLDYLGNGINQNRVKGLIHQGSGLFKDIDRGSWFVNELEFKKNVNGYGNHTFGGNKPDFDSLWGSLVTITLAGKKENNIDKLSGQIYLPRKLKIKFKTDGTPPIQDGIQNSISVKKGESIIINWDKDENYHDDLLISLNIYKPINYSLKTNEDFKEFNIGKTWAPDGDLRSIARVDCSNDIGEFTIKPSWMEDLDSGNSFLVRVSRRTSKVISDNKSSYIIFADYRVERNFTIE